MTYGRLIVGLGLCLSMAVAGGCSVLGAAADKLSAGGAIPARHKLRAVSTVVIAENFRSPSAAFLEAEQVSRLVYEDLKGRQAAPMVSVDDLYRLRDRKPNFKDMTIPEIGREVGAEQVVYINLSPIAVEATGGEIQRMTLEARVRIVDVRTGETLWPEDAAEGYPITAKQRPNAEAMKRTPEQSVRDGMCRALAVRIGQLFYDRREDE